MMRKLVKAVVCSFLLVGLTACVSDSSADVSKDQPNTQNAQDEYIEAFIERYNAYINSTNADGAGVTPIRLPTLSMDNFYELSEKEVGTNYRKYRQCAFESGSGATFIIEDNGEIESIAYNVDREKISIDDPNTVPWKIQTLLFGVDENMTRDEAIEGE